MEILLTILLESCLYAYADLAERLLDKKQLSKGWSLFWKILCSCVSVVALFLVLIGAFWSADNQPFKTYGTIMLWIGVGVLLAHILIALFVGGSRVVEEKRQEESEIAEETKNSQPEPIVQIIDEIDDRDGE